MKIAASYKDIKIMAPDDASFSFFKSPFAAHDTGSAVDIAYGDFGSMAVLPVDGTVFDVKEFDSPTPFKDRDFKEYITAILCGELLVKILHVKPAVKIGDCIRAGEYFGTFIRSGYYYFWNFPHLHVEVRRPDDYLRASNNMVLDVPVGVIEKCNNKPENLSVFEFTGEVVFSNKMYALVDCPDYSTFGLVNGYSVNGFLLDGFIPTGEHALHRFGLIGTKQNVPPFKYFKSIGDSYLVHPSSVNLRVFDGNNRLLKVAGASFILSFGKPLIKLVPTQHGACLPQCGEKIVVKIEKRIHCTLM